MKLTLTSPLSSAFLLLLVTGCQSMNLSLPMTGEKDEIPAATKENPAQEVLALWQPGEGRDTKGLPCRGFAGQLFFFQRGSESPVKVEGHVQVYLFDDQGTEDEQAKPLHVYQFLDGTWNQYLTNTNLGPAYQVFIPYPRRGSHQAKCSLRAKYINQEGATVFSETADLVLIGTKSDGKNESVVAVSDQQKTKTHQLSDPNQTIRIVNNKVQLAAPDALQMATASQSPIAQAMHVQQQGTALGSTDPQAQLVALKAELAAMKQQLAASHSQSGVAQVSYEQSAQPAMQHPAVSADHPLRPQQSNPQMPHQYMSEEQLRATAAEPPQTHPLQSFSDNASHLNVYTLED